MKKTFALLAVLLIASLVLAACGGTAATPTAAPVEEPTTAPVEEPTTAPVEEPTAAPVEEPTADTGGGACTGTPVKITVWHGWAGAYLEAIETVFADYTAKVDPCVTIELSKVDNLNDALAVAVPAGEGPDVLAWVNDQIGKNALSGNIVPLDDQGITQDFLKETYEPAAVQGMVWQNEIWGLPESQEGITLILNKAVATAADFPTDPTDFAALLEAAKKFQEANPDKALFCNQGLGNPDAYHAGTIYFGHGMPGYVDDEGTVYMNTPEGIAAATWMKEATAYLPKETSHEICKAGLIEGKFGAWWSGPWAIADLEAAGVDYELLTFGKPFVGIKTLMLTPNAVDRGNAAAAVEVMKYFTSADVQKSLALINKTVPAATAALNSPELQAEPIIQGFAKVLSTGVPAANTPYADAQWGPVGDATTAVWTGAQTPEEAMAAAQEAIEKNIAQMQ
jgi:arabinogalactan oligomer/maltooligosaccharide transport system substrate-binding protein